MTPCGGPLNWARIHPKSNHKAKRLRKSGGAFLYLIDRNEQGHGDDAQQHGHSVDEPCIFGVQVVDLAELGHHVGSGGKGGDQGHQHQRLPLGIQAGKMQDPGQKDQNQGQDHQPEKDRLPDAAVALQVLQLQIRHQHAYDQHGGGTQHTADAGQGVAEDLRQPDVQKEQRRSQQNGDDVDIPQDLFQGKLPLPAHEHAAVGPDKQALDHVVQRDEHHPLRAENGVDQRNGHVAGVGVGGGGLLHHVHMEYHRRQPGQQQHHRVEGDGQDGGKAHHGHHLGGPFDLEGVEKHAGGDDVQQDHGKAAAVLCFQDAHLHHDPSHENHQEQLRDPLEQQEAQHDSSTSFSRSR